MMRIVSLIVIATLLFSTSAFGETWDYKKIFQPYLTDAVPEMLKSQDKKTGVWGTGPWGPRDQENIYALAVAWQLNASDNPWYHKPEVLDAIMLGGDKLVAEQRPSGRWIFRKKDGSEWGEIYMPWTFTRWIRTYSLIKDAMPADRRAKWETAFKHAYEGIADEEMKKRMANIPTLNAMGLYIAGKEFNRKDWQDKAVAYLHSAVDYQSPAGFWSEHGGPVVMYSGVYLEALGPYYALSGDKYVLPALQRAAKFHIAMLYPDGVPIETVDERNGYLGMLFTPNVGLTFSPEGRGLIKLQYDRRMAAHSAPVTADSAASYILNGEEGDVEVPPATSNDQVYVTLDHNAMTRRAAPWFTCLSAYHTDISDSRWYEDRQNLVSVYHDKVGMIVVGGNTKLQPLWSSFSVGDIDLLKHKPGDENPNFIPPLGLVHTPNDAALDVDQTRLILQYNLIKCQLRVDLSDPKHAKLIYSTLGATPANSGDESPSAHGPVAAHVVLYPHLGEEWTTESGKSGKLSDDPIKLGPGEAGKWFGHHGWRIDLPKDATVQWPVLPHNQYVKDGHAETKEGRIIVTLPFDQTTLSQEVDLEVP
jgi:hypothetical protein